MRPAFDSTRQAAAFALLLLFSLTAPWLSAKKLLPQPKQTYSSESTRWERFQWVQKFIYEETNAIDIAFVGSSHIDLGINTPYVQQKLDERLGRKSVVRTIAWSGGGFDSLYFFTKDLLAHRHVKVLVFYDEAAGDKADEVQQFVTHWFDWGEGQEVVAGLPLGEQAVYYYASVIGMPRNLLELLTSNLPSDPNSTPISYVSKFKYLAADPETTLGCFEAHRSFNPLLGINGEVPFTPSTPQTGAMPSDVCTYSSETASNFAFSNQSLPVFQTYFAKQFGRLAENNGCKLVALHFPVFAERKSALITESRNWAGLLQTNVHMMGIPGERLFAGLSDSETGRLYYDPVHLNENGQRYFTSLITPTLLQFYVHEVAR